jgi:hypothetical protein
MESGVERLPVFVLTPTTVLNPKALAERPVPKPVLGKGLGALPKGQMLRGPFWRMVFEHSLPRYLVALAPFPAAILIWPDLALPISQAPLLMIGLVLFLETSVLSIGSPDRRRRMADADEAARALDLLRVRGRAVLTRIAAGRGMGQGVLTLVVEQSAMARVRPLTLVRVRQEGEVPEVLELTPKERGLLEAGLFGEGLEEGLLHRVNTAENVFLRTVALDAREISAHARLAAMGARSAVSGRG